MYRDCTAAVMPPQVVKYFIEVIGMDTDSINLTQGKSRLRTAMDYALQPVDGQTDAIATGKYELLIAVALCLNGVTVIRARCNANPAATTTATTTITAIATNHVIAIGARFKVGALCGWQYVTCTSCCNSCLVNTLAGREKYTMLHVAGTGNHVKLAEVITHHQTYAISITLYTDNTPARAACYEFCNILLLLQHTITHQAGVTVL
eukprot:880-Heterococcus_DN1.PRE.2